MGLQTSQVMLLSRSAGETGHRLQRSQQTPLGCCNLPIPRKLGVQSTSRLAPEFLPTQLCGMLLDQEYAADRGRNAAEKIFDGRLRAWRRIRSSGTDPL